MREGRKKGVVKTYPLFRIVAWVVFCGHHVLAMHEAKEGRERAPVLECGGESSGLGGTGRPAAGALPWRD